MAEFLIKAIDATHSDPEKDARGCYKRGDIVVVMPDGHEWGKCECLPKFVIVKIPGLDHEQAKKYTEEHEGVARRKFRLLVDNVPPSIKKQLRNEGVVSVPWSQVKSFVQNKMTQAVES